MLYGHCTGQKHLMSSIVLAKMTHNIFQKGFIEIVMSVYWRYSFFKNCLLFTFYVLSSARYWVYKVRWGDRERDLSVTWINEVLDISRGYAVFSSSLMLTCTVSLLVYTVSQLQWLGEHKAFLASVVVIKHHLKQI